MSLHEQDALERKLRAELDTAAEQYNHAKQIHQAALKAQAEIPFSHYSTSSEAIRTALLDENHARESYATDLEAFVEFILTGKVPEDIFLRGAPHGGPAAPAGLSAHLSSLQEPQAIGGACVSTQGRGTVLR